MSSLVIKPLWPRTGLGLGLGLGALGLALACGLGGQRSRPSAPVIPPAWQLESPGNLRPSLVVLPAGTFTMGRSGDVDRPVTPLTVQPPHQVTLTQRLAVSESEITQAQYQAVMQHNPAAYRHRANWRDLPVDSVSWGDAIEYCNRLSTMEGLTPCYRVSEDPRQPDAVSWPHGVHCAGYRLPTEAEWEYVARAGATTAYAGSELPRPVGWTDDSDNDGGPHAVKGKSANAWGLYDMSGNVTEWVWDWYGDYQPEAQTNPSGAWNVRTITGYQSGIGRKSPTLQAGRPVKVQRGGSARSAVGFARVTARAYADPDVHYSTVGFRIARTYP